MADYILKKSSLQIEGDTLSRRNNAGGVVASLEVSRITEAKIRRELDPICIGVFVVLVGLAWGCYAYLSSDFWRWAGMLISALCALLCAAALHRNIIVLRSGSDLVEFQLNDLLEDGQAFVAMLNQRNKKEPNRTPEPTSGLSAP